MSTKDGGGMRGWRRQGLIGLTLAWLILGVLGPPAAQAAHKLPNGPPPFAYPVTPPTPLLVQDDAPPVVQAATPAPTPGPAPAAGGLTLDRFALGFVLIVIGTLGAGLAVLGLRRARRLRDATLPPNNPSSRRP